ncbi:(Fe-S)-binding protein [Parahaliea aestuarii]|uniref:(Fe-S)-binding protein n=1 Tax=Parahaliea aestuarii TaxID=1852021 RepID=A0A5C8ZZC8_9GAMM|nr:(Fe-S)-binding protein [Parahaliea aestuarii]TXS93094.1 (Fe-S)-binding protein [Parahaliea aestuarii]
MASRDTVGLFATCPVDLFRPGVGFATARLLEQAGYRVEVPPQSCCGQVNYNNGDTGHARELAWQLVQQFENYAYTVVPSGSCTGMIRCHYPDLFAGDPRQGRVKAFCERVYELTTFLVEVADYQPVTTQSATQHGTLSYHDSCAGLRELGIQSQPRTLLRHCADSEVQEMADTEVCCGFGGTFCVKFGNVSARMADNKLDNAVAAGADTLLGGDLSCLLHLAGRARRRGLNLAVRHVAEVLAGESGPGIGEAHASEPQV